MINKAEIHKQICDNLNTIYKAKNADYGDSYGILRQQYPEAIIIRLSDKLSRLKTLLTKQEQQVQDESIEDTLIDLANYAIMEVVERRHDNFGKTGAVWEDYPSDLYKRCSACKTEFEKSKLPKTLNYCPNCGEKMRGEEGEQE